MTPTKCQGCSHFQAGNPEEHKRGYCKFESRVITKISECPIQWIPESPLISKKADAFAQREYSCGAEERDALAKGYYCGYRDAMKELDKK